MTAPLPLPEIKPWPGHLQPVPDMPAGDTRVTVTPPAAAAPADTRPSAPAATGDNGTDARGVTRTPAGPVTDTPPSPVSDADTDGDSDTDTGLPEFEEFGEEIGPVANACFTLLHGVRVFSAVSWESLRKTRTFTTPPQSVAAHVEWIRDSSWIPEDQADAGPVIFLNILRRIWGYSFGLLATVLGNFIAWLAHPAHFIAVAVAVTLLDVLVIH